MSTYRYRLSFLLRLAPAWLMFLLLLAGYWLLLGVYQQQQLEASEQSAVLRAEQTVHALATQVDARLATIQFFVEHLTEHWLDHQPAVFNKLIAMGQTSIFKGDLDMVLVTDASGQVVFSSVGLPQPKSLNTRAYFQQHASSELEFNISQPLKNLLTDHWTLQFSQSYFVDGEFAGVVVAAVRAEHFSNQFNMIYPDKNDVVLLLSADGYYLIRSQASEDHMGKKVPDSREFIRNPAAISGTYAVQAPIDGGNRFYAWHRLQNYPLVLSLGLAKNKILQPVLNSIQRIRTTSLITSILLVIAAFWISRLAYFRARQARNLLQTRERLTTLLKRIPSAVLLEDENSRIVAINHNFCQLMRITRNPDSLLGMQHQQLLELMDEPLARLLPQSHKRDTTNSHHELQDHLGRTLELDHVAICRNNRYLGHGWFIQDISCRKKKESELITLASTDSLTGLANRRSFLAALENQLACSNKEQPGALLLLDIDHFKKINDTYGHPAGDEVIRAVTQLIKDSVRRDDVCGRLGGEEFAVLLPNASLQQAIQLAERIRSRIELAQTVAGQHAIRVTISIGISTLYGADVKSAHSSADAALYRAKQQGRNQVCY